jgi:monoterpene epsilon-lactone hydrolase
MDTPPLGNSDWDGIHVSDVLLTLVLVLAATIGVVWATAFLFLRGENLARFDLPLGKAMQSDKPASAAHQLAVASFARLATNLKTVPNRERIGYLRNYMDNMFAGRKFDATFTPVDAGGVAAEWVVAPNGDPAKRMLYIHGGDYTMGSPRSHRTLTSRFAAITGGAVLAIDYRLMPEHPRMAGIEDCRTAYRWLLENGPGEHGHGTPATVVYIGGDSAGGNLTLSLIAWIRDQGLRAPNAAVALSPNTDVSLASPSLRSNLKTDPMLGPLFKTLAALPKAVLLWMAWLQNRMLPHNPMISPVYGDLTNLPPVLVHVSECEMLRDDACRYVNKAIAAGSPVVLQAWPHMMHVWQIFNPELPEAEQAFDEIGKFLHAHA